jgi:hypothetical protein
MEKFFFGNLNLVPFIGIVERRDLDPLHIGRCKVRAFGHHTSDTAALPTESLPDAYPLESLQGTFWSTPYEGDTVFGYFLDPPHNQSMLICGKVPTAQQSSVTHPEGGSGFRDSRPPQTLPTYPRQEFAEYYYSSDGQQNGTPALQTEELPEAKVYPPHGVTSPSVPFRISPTTFNAPAPHSPESFKARASTTRFSTALGSTFTEKESPYAATYPFNHVYQSESLHFFEFDDTPSAERVLLAHRMGTFFEFHPDGSSVTHIMRDSFHVTIGDSWVGIVGDSHVNIKGDSTLYIEGDLTTHVNGDYRLSIDGDFFTKVGGKKVTNVGADSHAKSGGDTVIRSSGTLYLKGDPLHENSASTPEVEDISDFDIPATSADSVTSENQESLVNTTSSPHAPADDFDESPQATTLSPIARAPTPANVLPTEAITCPTVERSLEPFTDGDTRYRMQLSRYFQLADLSIRTLYPHHITSQRGLDQAHIICNLANIAQLVLDPLLARQFPGGTINAAFRKVTLGHSQHETGEAVDIQWSSYTPSKYLEVANWIIANIPFDSLILEHGEVGSDSLWLHISLSRLGTNRRLLLTQKNGTFSSGLSV